MADSVEKRAVTVRIGGEDHTIRANVEPEYTEECARLVDDRISEIRSQLGRIESHKAAILAALSITDELFQARIQLEEHQGSVAERASGLALRLEEVLLEQEEKEGVGE